MMPYIINVALVLTGCLAFYKLLLQKQTFYRVNRYVLLTCLAIAFSLPLLKVPQQLSLRHVNAPVTVHNATPVVARNESTTTTLNSVTQSAQAKEQRPPVQHQPVSWQQVMQWAAGLYWVGLGLFTLN